MKGDIKTTLDVLCQLNFEKIMDISILKDEIRKLTETLDEKEKEIKKLEELLKVRDGVKEIIADVQEKAKRGRPAKEVQNG
ncbi:hypothetical protein [uncultured Fusobacterium sp.]|uniref:hypothetical protein n=1 Tax=uncultured Fusobacterium sp. TaxID=159267 RepID=UPI0025CCD247|nr:hypothetical protein [uncultured Fusobacterium sp.]